MVRMADTHPFTNRSRQRHRFRTRQALALFWKAKRELQELREKHRDAVAIPIPPASYTRIMQTVDDCQSTPNTTPLLSQELQ